MSQVHPSRAALRAWFDVTGCSQGRLGQAVGVTQQRISEILRTEQPPVALAQLIQEATGVAWEGWFTPTQLRRREDKHQRRIAQARALRAAFPVAS